MTMTAPTLELEHGLPEPTLPHQWETYNSKAKFTLQSGAYGSGKTNTNAWIILRQMLEYSGTLDRGTHSGRMVERLVGFQVEEEAQGSLKAAVCEMEARFHYSIRCQI